MSGSSIGRLPFLKMQGTGNDFVTVDCLTADAPQDAAALQSAAVRLCDRRFGIGSDGLLLVLPSTIADFQMRMFNPDGSEAEMCGNGIRCIGKFVRDNGYTDKDTVSVETLGGIKTLHLTVEGGKVGAVTVDMGKPGLDRADLPMTGTPGSALDEPVTIDGETVRITGISMGNPHAVFFVEEMTDAAINRLGPRIETHPLFPRRTNVHAVRVHNRREITMLTWERGAGRTLACGTGACGCVVASVLNGLTDRDVRVHLAGGDLRIEWRADDHIYMTGPAVTVFTGVIDL